MFHAELRQFPHQTRVFNLTREELDARILKPWAAGTAVEVDERRWSPERARLTVYEGPRLEPDQLGLGRGWANVTRAGQDVTARVVAEAQEAVAHPPPVLDLKYDIVARCAGGPVGLGKVVELAGERYPRSRVSEQVALAEQAVWELLHEGRVQLVSAGGTVLVPDEWRSTLLDWRSWTAGAVAIRAA